LAVSGTLKGGHQTLRTRQNEIAALLPCFGKVQAGRAPGGALNFRDEAAPPPGRIENRGLAENEFVSTVAG